jgi:hypothetical protein
MQSALPLRDRLLHCLPIQLRVLRRRWHLRQVVVHLDPDDCISLWEMAPTSSTASLPHFASMPHSSYSAPMGAIDPGLHAEVIRALGGTSTPLCSVDRAEVVEPCVVR